MFIFFLYTSWCFGAFFFFFNDTATTEIYTLFPTRRSSDLGTCREHLLQLLTEHPRGLPIGRLRSEEHTSELQSPGELVCSLLLEKKNKFQKAASKMKKTTPMTAQRTTTTIN